MSYYTCYYVFRYTNNTIFAVFRCIFFKFDWFHTRYHANRVENMDHR